MPVDPLPPAPLPSDSRTQFNAKSGVFVQALNPFGQQVSAVEATVVGLAAAADSDAIAAMGYRNTANLAATTATTKRDETVAAADVVATKRDEVVAARDVAVPAAAAAIAARDQAQVFATQQLKGSSASNLTPGVGAKSFSMEAGRAFVVGMYVVATSSGAPSARMAGYIASYNATTGALVINVDAYGGTGAHTDWAIGIAVPGAVAGITTQVVTANTPCVANVLYIVAAAGIVLTLPTSWTPGDKFAVRESIGNPATYTLAFGSTPMRRVARGTHVVNAQFAGMDLIYKDATEGLI